MDVHQYVKVAYVRLTPVKICTQGENVYRRLTTELDMEFTRFLKENPYESYSYLQGALISACYCKIYSVERMPGFIFILIKIP